VASEKLAHFEAADIDGAFIARTGYTGEDGFEILIAADRVEALWRALARSGVHPAGLGARDTLRLEAGMNLYGQDMDESVTPLECGLAWTVDTKTERQFIGRAALARRPAERTLVGLVLGERGVMRTHQRVWTEAGEGELTSGGYSPTMNRSIGLARVPRSARYGSEAQVDVRGRRLAAKVVKPPFVRHGRILVEQGSGNDDT
jgi:aminomethyltransferase